MGDVPGHDFHGNQYTSATEWADTLKGDVVFRAMHKDDLTRVQRDGTLTGGRPGEVWASTAPKPEYLDPGEVIAAIRVGPGDRIGGGFAGDVKLRELPSDRIVGHFIPTQFAAETLEFGDVEGHPFRGNQWTGGQGGGDDVHAGLDQALALLTPKEGRDYLRAMNNMPGANTDLEREMRGVLKQVEAGMKVIVPQPKVATLMQELHEYTQECKNLGVNAPNIDLCSITVPGTNYFCAGNLDIPRIDMPQLAAEASKFAPDAEAIKLGIEPNDRGWIDLANPFVDHLRDSGIKVTDEEIPSGQLRATQRELDGAKVAGIMATIEKEGLPPGTIFVSKDNYVLDGHHRWAGTFGEDYKDGDPNDFKVPVQKIDLPMEALLPLTLAYTSQMGIPGAAVFDRQKTLPNGRVASAMEFGDSEGHPFRGNQWTGGRGDAALDGMRQLESRVDVDRFIETHPPLPGEGSFAWQGRIVRGMTVRDQCDVLFETRETPPVVDFIKNGADRYCAERGLPPLPDNLNEVKVDVQEADQIARWFENAPDRSGDPVVQAAYEDFKRQNEEMFDFMTKPESEGGMGVKVDFTNEVDPYPTAEAQARDLAENRHITIQSGLGGDHSATMTTEEYDRFRAVHDVFGHAGIGGGFDRHGEYQAWLAHASMYTGAGRAAMSTEYHAVNSAMWSGAPGSPGTGKSVLMPAIWANPPWDREGLTAAGKKSWAAEFVEKAGVPTDGSFARAFDQLPLHPERDNGTAKTGVTLAALPSRLIPED